MSLPMRVLEEKGTMRAETSIDVRGRCSKDHLTEAHLIVGVTVDHQIHREGDKLSAQQRKMGIAAIQEMYTMALKFLGHEIATDLLPGMVVRVLSPLPEQSNRLQYIGVVEWVREGQMLLRTLHYGAGATERLVRITLKHHDVEQDPNYMGIDGLKELIRGDSQAPVEAGSRALADAAAIASIGDVEGWPNAPKTPVENAWIVLLGGAVATKATVISMEQDGGELQILIHARGEKIPYHASHGCSNRDLYDHVKLVAGMNLESKETQKTKFSSGFFLQDVTCVVETFFRDDSPVEGLFITLVY